MLSRLAIIEMIRRQWSLLSLLIVVMAIAIWGSFGSVILHRTITDAFIKLIIVVGLYIFVGNSGVLSFGHASFMTIAAYLSAWLTMSPARKEAILPDLWPFLAKVEVPVIPGSIIAGFVAAAFACIIGIPLMRMSGLAASIGTLAVLTIIHSIYGHWDSMTYGQGALVGLPVYSDIWVTSVWALVAIGAAFVYQESRFGIALRASREDEVAARMRTLALTIAIIWANILIMNTPKYHLQALMQFFDRHKIATLDQLREALGNPARCTVFRKLSDLQYLSSYSHRGKYYTLKSIARFSEQGLWSFRSVWFSRFGNLLQTCRSLRASFRCRLQCRRTQRHSSG
jgi:hypothetical protein